jgi:hypothetical protein
MPMLTQPSKRSSVVRPKRAAQPTGTGEVADGRSATLRDDGVDELVCLHHRVGVVVGVDAREVADEVLVGDGELHGEGLDHVVVEADTAERSNHGMGPTSQGGGVVRSCRWSTNVFTLGEM